LNNRERNDIYLTPSDSNHQTYLCIGGGAGRYLVTGCIENGRFPTLIDPSKPEQEKERIVSRGQEVLVPSQWVVDLESVLKAARSFFEAGDFNSGIAWRFD